MNKPQDERAARPERESHQPLAEINKDEADRSKPDPELGQHGPLVGESPRNEHGKPRD